MARHDEAHRADGSSLYSTRGDDIESASLASRHSLTSIAQSSMPQTDYATNRRGHSIMIKTTIRLISQNPNKTIRRPTTILRLVAANWSDR